MSKHIELAVDILVNEMVDSGATNYKSWIMDCSNESEYLVTVQKKDGETAVEQLAKLQEEIAELKDDLEFICRMSKCSIHWRSDAERIEKILAKHNKGE